jgi:anaerobic magnesium-protoporphyrin IX monomethyl ester cyclase
MKVALVYPPCQELNLKGYPLGLGYLAGSLKRRHQVYIYNYNGKPYRRSIQSFLQTIKEVKPDLVGISFTSFNRWAAFKILREVKRIDKNIVVVMGGVHASALYRQIFQYFNKDLDFIIQSEGESSLYNLCNALEEKRDYRNISGLVFKDEATGIIANPVTDIAKDLDDLPFPDYSFAEQEIREKKMAYLIASRGCPVNCVFCSTSSFWGQNVRMNSPERVAEEVDYVKNMGAERIFFHDDTFNLGIERTLKMADVLSKKNIEYAVSCRVRPVNEEMISRLVGSGCRQITWGVETLSEKLLKIIDKKITREDVKNAFDLSAKYSDKLASGAFCCVGLPGETEETVRETVEYLNMNIKSTNGPGTSILYILPGTRVYGDLLEAKKIDERIWIKSDSVYYYTLENNIRDLNRWRKEINHSGIRLPYARGDFWDFLPGTKDEQESVIGKRFDKTIRKLKRHLNLMRNRY